LDALRAFESDMDSKDRSLAQHYTKAKSDTNGTTE
jgi:hypothetical protein